jgi:hypothetical protein
LLLAVCVVVASGCRGKPEPTDIMRGQPMETECDQIARNSSLKVELDLRQGRALVRFTNKTRVPLWFPAEEQPAFTPDAQARTLVIRFGYFDEVFGQYKGRYMLPSMQLVRPGTDLTIQLTPPALVQRLLEQRLSPLLQARVATKELAVSNIRGKQPLEDYIQHSCIVQSQQP